MAHRRIGDHRGRAASAWRLASPFVRLAGKSRHFLQLGEPLIPTKIQMFNRNWGLSQLPGKCLWGNKWGNKRRETKPVAIHPFRATLRRTLTLSTALDIIAETFKVSLSGEASYLQRTFGENLCANLS